MKLHNLKDIIAMNKKEMNLLRCVDDSAFILKDWKNLIGGSRIIEEVISKWDLMMHAGSIDKKIKTEISHVPSYKKIRKWRNQIDENSLTNNDVDVYI